MTGWQTRALPILAALLAFAPSGCGVFGPKIVHQTHDHYSAAVQAVSEEELLKNIVRMRYIEAPRNLQVAAIAAQYELSSTLEARPFFGTESNNNNIFTSFTAVLPFFGVSMADRPTLSLTPQDDGTTVRQFMTPISAETLIFLSQAGWPAGSILRIWVDRLNGVPNWVPASGPTRDLPADFERFRRACDLLQIAQDRELVSLFVEKRAVEEGGPLPSESITAQAIVEAAKSGMEYRPSSDGKSWSLIRKVNQLVLNTNPNGQNSPEKLEIAQLLNLDPNLQRYELHVATGVPDPGKNPVPPLSIISLTPRSTASAFFYLANGVDVPQEHIACGLVRVPPGPPPEQATEGIFRVHCCKGLKHKRPACAYTAIWYRDHWFYIDDRDTDSKATLFLMLQLRRLDFKRQEIGAVPALTLPVGR